MTPLSELICELKALEAKATKGPWHVDSASGVMDEHGGVICYPCGDMTTEDERANFIAATRNALPRLLEELEAAHQVIKAVEDQGSNGTCPKCGGYVRDQYVEHEPDCALAALLSRWEPQEKVGGEG